MVGVDGKHSALSLDCSLEKPSALQLDLWLARLSEPLLVHQLVPLSEWLTELLSALLMPLLLVLLSAASE